MALLTLPLLFLNLGGEMVYILDQRLRAHRVSREKSMKVLEDICGLMLNERFVEELFTPQPLGHIAALRSLFQDLAHASIMRLDEESMSKMWDLMTMSVKHQAVRAASPAELVFATLNHLDAIREEVPGVRVQAEHAHGMIVKHYARMPSGELQSVRYSLLNYLQGLAVRVSLFLRQDVQDASGRLHLPMDGPVPPGCEVPGTLRVLDGCGQEDDAVIQVLHFPCGGNFSGPRDPGSWDLYGCRGTTLGVNMYRSDEDLVAGARAQGQTPTQHAGASAQQAPAPALDAKPLRVGREELNMLMAQLLGNTPSPRSVPSRIIRVSLFNAQDSPEAPAAAAAAGGEETPAEAELGQQRSPSRSSILNIDATGSAGSRSASLQQVLSDLDLDRESRERPPPDLVGYMDLWEDLG